MKKNSGFTLLIVIALILSNLSAVFADDGAVAEPAADPQQVEVIADETAETVVEDETAAPQAAESEETFTELVEVLSEADVEVVSEDGTALPLASQEAAEILASTDPFFWNGTQWVGYTVSGTGCPANVICFASATPFQEAVTQAGVGNMVYVASGNYAEDVIINHANQSLIAFHDVTVADAALPNITINSSGYAVVRSITLNVNLTLNTGVYADLVVVNEPGKTAGRLDDAMELVNDGGRIQADVVIYGADGHYRVRDINHPETHFEWECGEPNTVIYPGRTYRMTLMNPLDQTIIDYYEAHGDERNTAPWNLNLNALDRIEDLRIAVNVSEEPGGSAKWNHFDEERIYWYLLGNTGSSSTSPNINLNGTQQPLADQITNGDWNNVTRFWDVWFMYPTLENNSTPVTAADRQLTFLVYDPRPVLGCMNPLAENFNRKADTPDQSCVYREGCMDPDALNFDPEALVEDQSCRYESTTVTPPQIAFGPLPIPVTGEEEFLIPVTGVDGNGSTGLLEISIAMASVMIIAASVILFKNKKEEVN